MKILDPELIYLAQTDTTVGFLSRNEKRLAEIKNRDPDKPFLIAVDGFGRLKSFLRVPRSHRKLVRRSKKSTFVYPCGKAIRVVKDKEHLKFLKRFGWLYSTSANRSGGRYEEKFAKALADVVVEDCRGLYEGKPSSIYRLSKSKILKLR